MLDMLEGVVFPQGLVLLEGMGLQEELDMPQMVDFPEGLAFLEGVDFPQPQLGTYHWHQNFVFFVSDNLQDLFAANFDFTNAETT